MFVKKLIDKRRDEILARFNYRPPDAPQKLMLNEVDWRIKNLAALLVDYLPDSRDRALALTSLENLRMEMNKAIIHSDLELVEDETTT